MRADIVGATSLAMAAAFAVGLMAQGGPTTEKTTGDVIAVTGCVTKAEAARGSGATAPAATYTLTKVTPSDTPVGASKTAAKPPAATQYRLSGPDSMVALYAGHQVEITGTVDTSAVPGRGAGASNVPTLKVETVYLRAATCS